MSLHPVNTGDAVRMKTNNMAGNLPQLQKLLSSHLVDQKMQPPLSTDETGETLSKAPSRVPKVTQKSLRAQEVKEPSSRILK